MGYTPHVLVVGGGSTGTGVARDLAMRGLEVTLVERGSLAAGTSGSMHALLHSGGRYAVDDPDTAALCARENRILKRVGGHLIEDTGGLFASLPEDPADYVATLRAACEATDIPTTDLDGEQARDRESTLSEDVERALAVPDAVVDPVGLCVANARAAIRHGADVRTGWLVVDVTTDAGAIDAVHLRNEDPDAEMLSTGGSDRLEPDYVVNAAGPWAGELAGMAGIGVPIRHSQGAMLVTERAGLETVVNRCRPRTEGDIAVPVGSTSVLGTTDRDAAGPEQVDRTQAAIDRLVDELAPVIPSVARARPYRADWGVRALPTEDAATTSEVSRSYTILDHETRDGCWGMCTVFGGKLTIYRHVAEQVADHVCGKFGIDRECRTADVELPDSRVGALNASEGGMGPEGPAGPDLVLCESEGVTRRSVRSVLEDQEVPPGTDLQAVVGRTGAATGACQGGRCGHRLTAELSSRAETTVCTRELEALMAERWRGLRFACWGEQLATAAETYHLHAGTMNRDGLPGPTGSGIDFGAYDAGPPTDGGDQQPGGGPDA